MTETKNSPVIVLLGDLVAHTIIERSAGKSDDEYPSHLMLTRDAHTAPLLQAIFTQALKDGRPKFKNQDIYIDADKDLFGDICDNRISILDRFPKSSGRKDGDKVLRVRNDYIAYKTSETEVEEEIPLKTAPFYDSIDRIGKRLLQDKKSTRARITVIYDQNGYTRDVANDQPGDPARYASLGSLIGNDDLVIGINSDINLWCSALEVLENDVFTAGSGRRPRRTLVTSADALRKAGVNIKKYGALEHSIRDIVGAMELDPIQKLLSHADDLIIIFRETGSLHIRNSEKNKKASIHYCPNFDRVAQADEREYGHVPAKFAIFLTAIVKSLYARAAEEEVSIGWEKKAPDEAIFGGALRLAAVAYNRHFTNGLLPEKTFKSIEQVLGTAECDEMAKACEDGSSRDYLACSLDLEPLTEAGNWTRTKKFIDEEGELALRRIVVDGLDRVLIKRPDSARPSTGEKSDQWRHSNNPWFPRSYISVPYVAFNHLKLLDTEEIAEHFELAKIIAKYIEDPGWRSPLSIAVFGKPGSGKSFSVTQILKYVDPSRKSEPLSFNLAQFSTVDQLTDAFHQIQDMALSSDEVPLAIFDEFDSVCDTEHLGWLKYFLAPMQDGLFRGKGGDYRVGRAILLFSGGTRSSYHEFATQTDKIEPSKMAEQSSEPTIFAADANRAFQEGQDRLKRAEFMRSSKLIDFLSRLRGYLDVSDINHSKHPAHPNLKKLRRAVLLRSLLERNAKPIMVEYSDGTVHARIDSTVIDAFFTCEYIYGVRSMEAIIQMSRWIEGRFVPASLPSKELLEIHVKDGKFLPAGDPEPPLQ
ncbi:hypothetical protein QCE63_16650 [Caballeronia sp. LZ065]|uniref:hypothetical protein n=1 Tax=Caballeronia sp. LZ065 TaxID=3038571 RepID=UPI00285677DA|nr:hypothetical protein [Caballeronia sp. LZ065]MDR5781054.1 hypothetical protein [Caballeronia sp. LZ065]